ncbi:MAG: DNA alkylation repair protein [Pseudomonadota bacterium]
MTPQAALAALRAEGDAAKAAQMARCHRTEREALGVSNVRLEALARAWRAETPSVEDRVALAAALWQSGVLEARIAAAKLLAQARIRGDAPVWSLVASWVPELDGRAIADAAAEAGRRRLVAAPERLDEVEAWTRSAHLWTRRAALVFTLPWSKGRHPSADDLARRERILGWVAGYVDDRDRFIQKTVAGWLRSLSKHDPDRVHAFLDAHGARMTPFAAREAASHLR